MSDPNAQNSNLKKPSRLGRGLGSLLSTAMTEVESAEPTPPPAAVPQPAAIPAPIQATAAEPPPTIAAAPVSTSAPVVAPPVAAPLAAPAVAAAVNTPVPASSEAPRINEESQIWKISVDRLRPNSQQPRQVFLPEALKDLTASIKEKGILQPIVARRVDGRTFEIIAGERRWRAAQAAGLHEVPVILKKVSEQDSLELAIIENIQRENLNPLEEAEAYDHLMSSYNLTQQMVADKLGKERVTIANSLRLLVLPREVKDMLKRSEISSGHAKVILSLENPIDQISIAKRAVSDRLSVRATEKLVARAKVAALESTGAEPKPPRQEVTKRAVEGLAAELQRLLGTKVSIDYADAKGKLNVHFYSDDELNSIVEKIRIACTK